MNPFNARPRLQDAALACLATAPVVASMVVLGFSALAMVLAALTGVALFMRRRSPIVVLAIVVVARLIMTWDVGNEFALIAAVMLALYTVARTGDRRSSLVIGVGAAVVMAVVVAALDSEDFVHELAGEIAIMLLPIAVGDAVRSRADRIRALIDTESAARVQAERLRIARDLHDVVAHGLSTIAIQSGVAAHLLDRDPGQAKESLEIINLTGKQALEELRAMVGVLRSTDGDVPLRPTPANPNDLSDVLAGAATAGLVVSATIDGHFPDDVGEGCVVAIHRIIQEALTNVARHAGPVPVELLLEHRVDEVRVKIENESGTSSGSAVASTGVGVVGMIERAEALGGSLRASGTADGGFVVDATIPYRHHAAMSQQP